MDDNKMQIIGQLMEELQELMGPKSEDFEERLGRSKPDADVAIMKVSAEPGMEGEMGMDDEYAGMDEDCSPEDKFKSRLMKLRA